MVTNQSTLLKSELINERLERKVAKLCVPKFEPRQYQKELFQEALKQNVIIYLGTGLGKTYITVLYLNDPRIDQLISNGKKAVFLAITQDLVKQQATYINNQVRFTVKIFCSRTAHCGKHIDHWSKNEWSKELETVDILFLTPQVFLNAISTNLLKWDQFCVIFYDECHHGCSPKVGKSGTQYYQLGQCFKKFYAINPEKEKPRVIGLTASLINSMPKSRVDVVDIIRSLERNFMSICKTDLGVQGEMPKMILQIFDQPISAPKDDIYNILECMIKLMNLKLNINKCTKAIHKGLNASDDEKKALSFVNRLKLASAGFSIKPTSFPKVLLGLQMIHDRCGLWAFKAMCERLANAVKMHTMGGIVCKNDIKTMYELFKRILAILNDSVMEFLNIDPEYELKFVRPKGNALLNILKDEYDRATKEAAQFGVDNAKTFSCIVFVRSRLEVVALNAWLQRRSQNDEEYNFIKCDYAIGLASTMNSKFSCITKRKPAEQAAMLDNFRKGLLNVIITTAVLEEGIDLPRCSTVIRYDEPGDFRQYVQSRGRARQQVSSFILMSELGGYKNLKDKMDKFNDFEQTVKEAFGRSELGSNLMRNSHSVANANQSGDDHSEAKDLMTEDMFHSDDMSLQIRASTAKTILHMYCARLSKGTPFAGNILYERNKPTGETFQTTLILPSGCPCQEPIIGNIKGNSDLADKSAIIAAIKRLYEMKEINEHAVPTRASESTIEQLLEKSKITIKRDKLNIAQSGFELTEEDRVSYLFEPEYVKNSDNLMQNCQQTNYKFVRVTFKPDVEESRQETRKFFQLPAYGLVLHNSVDAQCLPKIVYSHYGKLNVEYTLLSDNFLLPRAQDHVKIMDYMFKLFTYGLALAQLDRNSFKSRCLVYCVPLDSKTSSQLDYNRMTDAFRTSAHRYLPIEGDIARIEKRYTLQNNYNNSRYQQQRVGASPTTVDYYLVKNANYRHLTPGSRVPGKPYTFLEDIYDRFGANIVHPSKCNQPIVEVVQISKALAELKPGEARARQVDYETRSMFFMEQMLDFVNIEASALMQLNALSVILYKAHQLTLANKLALKMNEATKGQVAINEVVNPPMEVDLSEAKSNANNDSITRQHKPNYGSANGQSNGDEDQLMQDSDNIAAVGSQDDSMRTEDLITQSELITDVNEEDDTDDDIIDQDDDDYDYDDELSSISSHEEDADLTCTSGSSLSPVFNKQEEKQLYESMMCKGQLDLNDNEDYNERMKSWDMRDYKETNLRTMSMETRIFANDCSDPRSYENSANYKSSFNDLNTKLASPLEQLCNLLENFEFRATSDDWLMDDDAEFEKRKARVDLAIKPSLLFDKFNEPMAKNQQNSGHNVGLLEALTLRSAQESYSLELVECLGDSFLKYMVSVVLYRNLDAHEGFLTSARSQLVSNKHFEYLAKFNYFGSYAIRYGFSKDALANQFGRPIKDKGNLKSYCTKLRPKDLADMFEAFIGYHLATQGQFKALMAMEWLGLDIFRKNLFESCETNGAELQSTSTSNQQQQQQQQQQQPFKFKRYPSSLIIEPENVEMQSLFRASAKKLHHFMDIIGYKFNDISHLIQAFTHASFINKCTRTYERLEFLGDAILDFLVTTTLYNSDQIKKTPGQLTQSRSALVNNYVFAKLAVEYKFDMFVMYFDLDMYNQLARVRLALNDDPELKFLDMIDFDPIVKLLADLFEAVAGAIYIDSGGSLDSVWSIYYPMMYANITSELNNPTRNPISLLFEKFAGRDRILFETRQDRVGHEIQFRVECKIRDFRSFEGSGENQMQAKLRAVQKAVDNLPDEKKLAELNQKYKESLPPSALDKRRNGMASRGRGSSRGSINKRGRGAPRGRSFQQNRAGPSDRYPQNNGQRFNSSSSMSRDRQQQMDANWRR